MDCSKVRDQFSALWEGNLDPSEEKKIRDHLASCSVCQKDFVRFDRTLRWLHSVDEAEVPEGFLWGIYEKMKSRKKEALLGDRPRLRWLNALSPMKLPIQAVAMVTIVFLALYLARMTPVEKPRLEGLGHEPLSSERTESGQKAESPSSGEKKIDDGVLPKPAPPVTEEADKGKFLSPGEKKLDAVAVQKRPAQEKGEERLSQESKAVPIEKPSPKENEVPGPPLLKEKKGEKVLPMARTGAFLELKPYKKIVLVITDREKAFSQIGELARQFGGEVVSAEERTVFLSLPSDSSKEFEKGLADVGSSIKASEVPSQRPVRPGLSTSSEREKSEPEEGNRGAAGLQAGGTNRITFEIVLVLK